MKNKKAVYVLGSLVLVVWGLILQKIFNSMGDDDTLPVGILKHHQKVPFNDYSYVDTARLLLDYRDPFGIVKFDTVKEERTGPVFTARILQDPPTINWDVIKYSGYIRKSGSKALIAIMNINGKALMMAEGETAEQFKLLKNMQDSIKMSYKGKTRVIKLNTVSL